MSGIRMRVLCMVLLLGMSSLSLSAPISEADEGRASLSVSIQNFAFSPSSLTIDVGDSVTWTNNDGASHTATSTSGPVSFDSGTLSQGASFTFTFNTAGTYDYRCDIHTSMTATITVVAPNSAPEVTSVALSPEPAATDDVLSVSASSSDADGDPVTLSYAWSINGNTIAETADTLDGSTWFDKDDVIQVEVTPNDGTTDGTAVSSSSITIINSAPEITSVAISPLPLNDETIATCTASGWDDADGDDEGYLYAWSQNGASLQVTSQSTGPFDADDVVSCTVTPNDGTHSGSAVGSSDVTVVSAGAPDADGDGVADTIDDCPGTPQGAVVNSNGCADADADGVSDDDDVCAGTPEGASVNDDGCAATQLDSDGDGIADSTDKCEGFDDLIDVDEDGIPDGCDPLINTGTDVIFTVDAADGNATISYTCAGMDGTDSVDDCMWAAEFSLPSDSEASEDHPHYWQWVLYSEGVSIEYSDLAEIALEDVNFTFSWVGEGCTTYECQNTTVHQNTHRGAYYLRATDCVWFQDPSVVQFEDGFDNNNTWRCFDAVGDYPSGLMIFHVTAAPTECEIWEQANPDLVNRAKLAGEMDNDCPHYDTDDGDGDGGEGSGTDDPADDGGEDSGTDDGVNGDEDEATSMPGFGLLLSISAALGAALIASRRRE